MTTKRRRIATAGIVSATVALSGHQVRSGGVVQHASPSVPPLHPDAFVPHDSSPEVSRSASLVAAPSGPDASTTATARAVPEPARAVGPDLGTFRATCYDLTGSTASGSAAGPGSIAVDPAVIPLGTHLHVAGYGDGIAVDTGRAIVGHRIDVWESSEAECMAFGVRWVDVERLAA